MAHTYMELFYHFAWATKRREASISREVEPHLYRYLRYGCEEMRVLVHALDGMPDHLHVACMLPVTLAIADFVGKIKGASSHFINHAEHGVTMSQAFDWQPGYGALTFAKHDLARIVGYVERQKEHHRKGTLSEKMEWCGE